MSPRLQTALANIAFARSYTRLLVDPFPVTDWFRMPPGGVTHVAWQVGHLAMAEYRLVLDRVRGRRADDANLIPESFLKLFRRESVVDADPAKYPAAAEIRAVFDRVHERVLADLPAVPDADLDGPLGTTHMICKTRLDALQWCSHHEAVHAGQIGLIRRLLGYPPIW
jgi:DinB superfamily